MLILSFIFVLQYMLEVEATLQVSSVTAFIDTSSNAFFKRTVETSQVNCYHLSRRADLNMSDEKFKECLYCFFEKTAINVCFSSSCCRFIYEIHNFFNLFKKNKKKQ